MASFRPFFNNFFALFLLLLLHFGCFIFTTNSHHHHNSSKKRNASPPSHSSPSLKHKTRKALSSSWSFLKRILTRTQTHPTPNPTITVSSRSSSFVFIVSQETLESDPQRTRPVGSRPESDISSDLQFPLRNDIYPCPACGEIFQKPNLLEKHQTIRHAVMELNDWDSGKNIVQIIFKTGWPEKAKEPKIHRVLKIHNSPIILTRFEEYRESVKLRAARNGVVRRRDERCLADGNELLRFYCATFLCELGQNGNSSICNHQFCSACGIIGSGFSPKMDGISTLSTGFKAHVAVPEDIEEEFGFMGVKRAMLVCRVIAGRVGCELDFVDKEDPGFDSVVGKGPGARMRLDEEDELLVFNPRAVLPCFVIMYTV
ncbi:zinc finger (C2H2 type) family protein [Actinidia rufa]|uniref:Zinc finger (C2H2 type) family protein n=1 Tax=Actinidia rufa TaxID=165716 RepID=A0A7J0H9I5_9ERIC|nr:zinc finger (C2H2 type) family protein [Actinidia rufa]